MLSAITILSTHFHKGRVLVTCTVEAEDEILGRVTALGYGANDLEALDDATDAMILALQMPETRYDTNEPIDDENDLCSMTIDLELHHVYG